MSLCEIRKIKEDVFIFTDMSLGWYYNSTVIFTSEGPIIVDVFSDEKQFNEIVEFIKAKGFHKPAAIIYTHWHSDHTTGNRTFKDCRIIAHESTVRHLEYLKNKLEGINKIDLIPIMPTETIEKSIEINIGGKKLKLMHCPEHTYDSILVYDVENKILIAGDNLVSKEVEFCMPPVIPADEDTNHLYLEDMFKMVEELEIDKIIPGHGLMIEPNELLALNKARYYKCLTTIQKESPPSSTSGAKLP